MDSIRPDEDELRADAPIAGSNRKTGQGRKKDSQASGSGGGKAPPAPAGREKGDVGGSSSGGLVWSLLVILVLVVAGGGWFGWQLFQQVETLESQLEEADYWARQSKLALARFEGELSETGENLEETGSSLDQRLGGLDSSLDEVNDEIRKLWVLANEKNRPQIASLAEEQKALTTRLDTVAGTLEDTGQQVTDLRSSTETLTTSLEQTRQTQQQDSERLQALSGDLDGLNERVAGIDDEVASRLQRFGQEQALTLDGLESRIQALEGGDGRLEELSRQLSATRSRLAEAEQTLKSVDASRSQLTSRLVRLQEQVDQLRAQ